MEACLRKKDGESRTALVSAELIEVGGEPCTVSVVADITERKRAEDVLSTVSRKLIEAHEEERTRIARELHDDINQRLAFLAVKLSSHKKEVAASDGSTKYFVDEIRQEVSDLGKDVQALSHRLHSSKLEYLGLAVAAGGFCKEFSLRHNVEIEFHDDNIPRNLPPEISLCLFRVLQEALQNALKYSGTRRYEASLECTPNDEIHLGVHDSGVGFDPESAINRHGLGLISMTERLKLVDGQLSIESKPQWAQLFTPVCHSTLK
jgi:signal transduction histidine kinase